MKTNIDLWRSERWNPWREFAGLQRRMDRFFDEFTSDASSNDSRREEFLPACDIEEMENHYVLTMDVPGIPKDQIKIEVTGDTLTVSGEHKEERKDEKSTKKVFERYSGNFFRSFTLPDVEADKVEAEYKDGVLRIALPKSAAAKSKRVEIGDGKGGFLQKLQGRSQEKKEHRAA